MKFFAYFLPQYHEIPENNEWWGKGFTEWTNVKAAKPLFDGHLQPKQPLNDNYYNLLDKATMEWQTNLMHQYDVDGMIYYHYYFKGRKLLEQPAENLLKWKEIQQPFFFCWANHSWNRSWEGKKEVLLSQEYGDINDWEEHFQYLLPFFLDKRYEKKDNMPLFMIYAFNFPEKNDMFTYFDKRCRDYGFAGIYLIETYASKWGQSRLQDDVKIFWEKCCSPVTKNIHFREPSTAILAYYFHKKDDFFHKLNIKARTQLGKLFHRPYLRILNGNKLFAQMIATCSEMRGIHGLYFEWDNTPRHKERGYIITPPDKSLFMNYLNKIKDDEYVFINAWNEWAEGMMMEPTTENKYKYLEWIQDWKNSVRKK